MREIISRLSTIAVCLGLSIVFSVQTVQAGGGQYQVVNFGVEQPVSGKSATLEVIVNDISTYPYGLIVGEEFRFIAHQDLNGASCEMVQKISDGQGKIKAFCKADVAGRFVFDIQPVTRNKIQDSVTYAIFFTNTVETPAPATPVPTQVPAVTPKPTLKPVSTPKPLSTVKPTIQPTPTAVPTPLASPSVRPSPIVVAATASTKMPEISTSSGNVFQRIWKTFQSFWDRLL